MLTLVFEVRLFGGSEVQVSDWQKMALDYSGGFGGCGLLGREWVWFPRAFSVNIKCDNWIINFWWSHSRWFSSWSGSLFSWSLLLAFLCTCRHILWTSQVLIKFEFLILELAQILIVFKQLNFKHKLKELAIFCFLCICHRLTNEARFFNLDFLQIWNSLKWNRKNRFTVVSKRLQLISIVFKWSSRSLHVDFFEIGRNPRFKPLQNSLCQNWVCFVKKRWRCNSIEIVFLVDWCSSPASFRRIEFV